MKEKTLSARQIIESLNGQHFESPLMPDSDDYITEKEKLAIFFSLVENSANAIVITNVNREIIYVNKKFEVRSGYKISEVLGKNPRILKSNKTPEGTYRELHRKLECGEAWKGIFINSHRDKSEYIERAMISPIVINDSIVGYIADKKDITLQKNAETKAINFAYYDQLTKLPNRAYFLDKVESLINEGSHCEGSFCILFSDLNRFKSINDSRGHVTGDMVLEKVARRLEKVINPKDTIARIGGDEFVFIHENATSSSIESLGMLISEAVEKPININDEMISIGISIGVSVWPEDGKSIDEILSHADIAMYNSKNNGDKLVRYDSNIGNDFRREVGISEKLRTAISKNQFYIVYQPKFNLKTNETIGMEALLRWRDNSFKEVSPNEFIPIAEKHNLMWDIGLWCIEKVCEDIKKWQSSGISIPGRVSINISIVQIENPIFFDTIVEIINKHSLSTNLFELELTESTLMSNPDLVMNTIHKLRSLGICISIDDFGTGFSSLAYLKRLNASILKIDKSFIDNISSDVNDQIIVKSMIELAKNLGLSVIAEGIEDEEQKNKLLSLGCVQGQGFYYSKPLTNHKILENYC